MREVNKQANYHLVANIFGGAVRRVILCNLCGIDEASAWGTMKPHGCSFRYNPDALNCICLQELIG